MSLDNLEQAEGLIKQAHGDYLIVVKHFTPGYAYIAGFIRDIETLNLLEDAAKNAFSEMRDKLKKNH